MSIFKEIWSDLRKKPEHDGEPYSIDEILSMDDEELGAEYRNSSLPVQKYSKKTVILLTVCRKTLKTIIILLIIALLIALMIKWPKVFYTVFGIIMLPTAFAVNILIDNCDDWFELDDYYEFPYLFKNIMIDDWDALVDETTSESENGDDTSRFREFMDRMKRIKDFNKKYWFSYKEKGEWLKIITPLASLHHDGVVIDDHVYNKLDGQLDLSGRSEELLKQMEEHEKTAELIKEDDASRKARIEARKARIEAERSDGKVNAMVSMINQYKARQAILEGSSDYKRIVDLKNKMKYDNNVFNERIEKVDPNS